MKLIAKAVIKAAVISSVVFGMASMLAAPSLAMNDSGGGGKKPSASKSTKPPTQPKPPSSPSGGGRRG